MNVSRRRFSIFALCSFSKFHLPLSSLMSTVVSSVLWNSLVQLLSRLFYKQLSCNFPILSGRYSLFKSRRVLVEIGCSAAPPYLHEGTFSECNVWTLWVFVFWSRRQNIWIVVSRVESQLNNIHISYSLKSIKEPIDNFLKGGYEAWKVIGRTICLSHLSGPIRLVSATLGSLRLEATLAARSPPHSRQWKINSCQSQLAVE